MTSSDDFSTNSLDPVWSVIGPAGIATSLGTTSTDAFLELVTPDGNYDAWNTNNSARVVRAVADEDFTLKTRVVADGEQDELIAVINGDSTDLLTNADFAYDVPI